MTLLQRLTIAIFGVLVLFAINVVSFAIGNNTIRESLDEVTDAVRGQLYASTLHQSLDNLHKQLLVLVTLRESAGQGISATEADRTRREIAELRALVQYMERATNEDSLPMHGVLVRETGLLFSDWEHLLLDLRRPLRRSISIDELKATYARTEQALAAFEATMIGVSRNESQQVEKTGKIIGRITIMVFLVSIFFTSFLGFRLIRHTNESLWRLRKGSYALAVATSPTASPCRQTTSSANLHRHSMKCRRSCAVRYRRCRRQRSRPTARMRPRAAFWPT